MKGFTKFMSYVSVALLSAWVMFMILAANNIVRLNNQSKLDRLEALIGQRFIGEADQTALEDAAAQAMVASLGDRWSYYIPASQYSAYLDRVSNSYCGVGITVSVSADSQIVVMQVTPGGPSEEAGILPDDILLEADGTPLDPLDLEAAADCIKGEAGTFVTLTVLRGGEQHSIRVERRTFDVPVATASMLADQIGLIKIENFDTRCADETITAIDSLLAQGAVALVFDVRNNGGGYKDEMVKILDYLLPEGDLFISEDYTGAVTTDRSDASCVEIPMAVLVNEDSYSAAEFFAAALREYDVATIVGEKTCGKGYFQSTFELGDGSAVGLSIGKYYTPSHTSLADVGITPDLEVAITEEEKTLLYYGRLEPECDPQLTAAVNALNTSRKSGIQP